MFIDTHTNTQNNETRWLNHYGSSATEQRMSIEEKEKNGKKAVTTTNCRSTKAQREMLSKSKVTAKNRGQKTI